MPIRLRNRFGIKTLKSYNTTIELTTDFTTI